MYSCQIKKIIYKNWAIIMLILDYLRRVCMIVAILWNCSVDSITWIADETHMRDHSFFRSLNFFIIILIFYGAISDLTHFVICSTGDGSMIRI